MWDRVPALLVRVLSLAPKFNKPSPCSLPPPPIQDFLRKASLPQVFVVLRMSLVGFTNIQDLYFGAK